MDEDMGAGRLGMFDFCGIAGMPGRMAPIGGPAAYGVEWGGGADPLPPRSLRRALLLSTVRAQPPAAVHIRGGRAREPKAASTALPTKPRGSVGESSLHPQRAQERCDLLLSIRDGDSAMSSANAANVDARRRLGALPPVQGELAPITIAQLPLKKPRTLSRLYAAPIVGAKE